MKRRSFTLGLAALAAAPAVPMGAIAAPAPAITAQQFGLAKLLARAHNHCSTDMLARHMKLTPDMAKSVQSLLLERGVITPPIAGVSMATNPMNTNCVPIEALKPTNLGQATLDIRAKVQKIKEKYDKIAEALGPEDAELEAAENPETDPNPEDQGKAI